MKEVAVDITLENRLLKKKHDRGWGRRSMRYSPSDKTEIIRVVEQSTLPARRTLGKLGIPRSSFYRWYDRYQRGGPEALADRPSRPDRVWNRIPEAIRSQIVDLALDQPELSPRELAVRFTDALNILSPGGGGRWAAERADLMAVPAYIVIEAAAGFEGARAAPNLLWPPDFNYLRSWATIFPPCWTTSRASLSPGSSARR